MVLLTPHEKIKVYRIRIQELEKQVHYDMFNAYKTHRKILRLENKITRLTKKMIG